MEEYFEPATPRDRVLAGIVDYGGAFLVLLFFAYINAPFIGFVLTTAYLLLKDGWEGQSIGKRWRKLCTVNLETEKLCDWKTSCLRNLTVAAPILGLIGLGIEFYLALKDADYRRYGDHFADTFVIRKAAMQGAD